MAAKKPSVNDVAMVLVLALVAIEHDGERYEKGEQFSIPADAVQPLADVGAVKIVGESADKSADEANNSNANT